MQGAEGRQGRMEWGRDGQDGEAMGAGRRADQGWDGDGIGGSSVCQILTFFQVDLPSLIHLC